MLILVKAAGEELFKKVDIFYDKTYGDRTQKNREVAEYRELSKIYKPIIDEYE